LNSAEPIYLAEKWVVLYVINRGNKHKAMAISELIHQEKKIIIVDYSALRKKEEMIAGAIEAKEYFLKVPEKDLLVLFDYTDTHLSSDFMKVAKESREELYKVKTFRSAALGITGIKKILVKGYNALRTSGEGIQVFDTKSEALKYLVA
jgi:hypothetical protein